MLPSILKGGNRPRANRRNRDGLRRRCHNFGRHTPAENTYDFDEYAAYLKAMKSHWRRIYTNKDVARTSRRLDRQRFRALDMFVDPLSGQCYPYVFTEETFRNTCANVARTRAYTERRNNNWAAAGYRASPRRSRMAPPPLLLHSLYLLHSIYQI